MADYGVQTWDASGQINNKGIMPFYSSLQISLAAGAGGSWSITLEPGSKAGFIFIPVSTADAQPAQFTRHIAVSGGTVTATITSQNPDANVSNVAGTLYIFLTDA